MKLVSIHDEYRKVLAGQKNKNKEGGATAEEVQQEEGESPEKKPEEVQETASPTKGGPEKELTEQERQINLFGGPR